MINYYIVGGFVRDRFLGVPSHDVDFAVEAPSYEAMKQDLIEKGVKIFLETPIYFTIRGSHPQYGGVDYVLCRKDGAYVDGRHPQNVYAGTLQDDLARRDFTINAIALDLDGEVIDPFNGQFDINAKLIRCVGLPQWRFKEDSLRILRAIRFAAKYGFSIEGNTYAAMQTFAHSVVLLPEERIRAELTKAFKANTVKTLELLRKLDLIDIIFRNSGNLWLMPTSKQ